MASEDVESLQELEEPCQASQSPRAIISIALGILLLGTLGVLGSAGLASHSATGFTKSSFEGSADVRKLRDCFQYGTYYGGPTHEPGTSKVFAPSAEACQEDCKNTARCAHFSFWPDGSCLLTDSRSRPMSSSQGVISGPAFCPGHPGETKQDYDNFGPGGSYEDYDPYDQPDNDGNSRRSPGHPGETKQDYDNFGPGGSYEDYDPYDQPDNDGNSRRSPGHPGETKQDYDNFGPGGSYEDYDPYDQPDNDGQSRRHP